jgi:hypothetical protein
VSRAVWKFPLEIGGITSATVSAGYVVLAAIDPASGKPAIWIEHRLDGLKDERRFVVYGTGHPIPGNGGYPDDLHVGSVIDGSFVWHIYERRAA